MPPLVYILRNIITKGHKKNLKRYNITVGPPLGIQPRSGQKGERIKKKTHNKTKFDQTLTYFYLEKHFFPPIFLRDLKAALSVSLSNT